MYKLRELERKDLTIINSWRNDYELIEQIGAPFRYINLEVDQKWFDFYMSNRGNQVRCAIVEENKDDILGYKRLLCSRKKSSCYSHRWLVNCLLPQYRCIHG